LRPPGGGNSVAVWMLQALKAEYDLTTLTRDRYDLQVSSDFYGTSLNASDLHARCAPHLRQLVDTAGPAPDVFKKSD